MRNRERIVEELERVFLSGTREHWVSLLRSHDVPCAPVRRLREALEIYGKDMIREVRGMKYLALPFNVGRGVELPAPRLGEHTLQVLKELGYSEGEILDLMRKGVIKGEE